MPSDLSNTLIQLSFPAAIQIIVFFIPVLYIVVRNNQALQESLTEDHVGIWGLIAAVVLCEALYISSVALILVGSNLPAVLSHMSGITDLDFAVLALLALFGLIPIFVGVDVMRRYAQSAKQDLPEPNVDEYNQRFEKCLRNKLGDIQEGPKSDLGVKIRKLKRMCTGAHRSIPTHLQEYCNDHAFAVRYLGLGALLNAPHADPRPDDLAKWLGDQLLYGRGYRRYRRKYRRVWEVPSDKMEVTFHALAAFAIINAQETLQEAAGAMIEGTESTRAAV